MLQTLRKSVASVFAKLLIGLLIIGFAIWGIGDLFTPNVAGRPVAKIGDVEITQQDFLYALRRQEAELRRFGIDPEPLREGLLTEQVVAGLVNRALYEAEARDLSLGVSDDMVVQAIRDIPDLRNAAGEFERARYELFLSGQGFSAAVYEDLMRRDLSVAMLLDAVREGVSTPAAMTQAIYDWRNETRSVRLMRVPVSLTVPVAPPSDQALQQFYDTDPERFRLPEYRKLSYIHIDTAALGGRLPVDEAALRQAYADRLEQYTEAERRDILQMILPDGDTARAAADALASGRPFTDVGREFAGMEPEGMRLQGLTRAEIPDPAVAEAAFSLALNQLSQPQQGLFGWFIVTPVKIVPEQVRSFAEVQAELRRELLQEAASDAAYDLSVRLDDAIAAGASFENAAAELGLQVHVLDGVTENGLTADGQRAADLPDIPDFLQSAYSVDKGRDSLMQPDGANGYYILRVDDIQESRIPPLSDVRSQVLLEWEDAERVRLARSRAEELLQRAGSGGGDMRAVAQAAGLKMQTLRNLYRSGLDETGVRLSSAVVDAVFAARPGEKILERSDDGDWVAAILDGVKRSGAQGDAEGLQQIDRELTREARNIMAMQFAAALRQRHAVEVDRTVIEALLAGSR